LGYNHHVLLPLMSPLTDRDGKSRFNDKDRIT